MLRFKILSTSEADCGPPHSQRPSPGCQGVPTESGQAAQLSSLTLLTGAQLLPPQVSHHPRCLCTCGLQLTLALEDLLSLGPPNEATVSAPPPPAPTPPSLHWGTAFSLGSWAVMGFLQEPEKMIPGSSDHVKWTRTSHVPTFVQARGQPSSIALPCPISGSQTLGPSLSPPSSGHCHVLSASSPPPPSTHTLTQNRRGR